MTMEFWFSSENKHKWVLGNLWEDLIRKLFIFFKAIELVSFQNIENEPNCAKIPSAFFIHLMKYMCYQFIYSGILERIAWKRQKDIYVCVSGFICRAKNRNILAINVFKKFICNIKMPFQNQINVIIWIDVEIIFEVCYTRISVLILTHLLIWVYL